LLGNHPEVATIGRGATSFNSAELASSLALYPSSDNSALTAVDADSLGEPSREELIALIRAQAAEIAALKARIAELERRLGLNSSNSGKPPSSDGLKKPPRVRSLREPSDKPSGGQKGHQGETLRQVTEPDRIVDHYPLSCTACGATDARHECRPLRPPGVRPAGAGCSRRHRASRP
jgi:transposase